MCFTLAWLLHILILFVLVAGTIAILRILIPWIAGLMGVGIPEPLMAIIRILIIMVIIIAAIIVIGSVLSCLWQSSGGFGLLSPR